MQICDTWIDSSIKLLSDIFIRKGNFLKGYKKQKPFVLDTHAFENGEYISSDHSPVHNILTMKGWNIIDDNIIVHVIKTRNFESLSITYVN